MNTVGTALRVLRLEANMGIKTAGPLVGVSYSYLSKVENGKKTPSIGLISALCELYGADADDVIAKAGALPPDVSQIIRDHGKSAYDLLRSTYTETK